jgi:ADP-heptose:LPS heptosyltransferase
VISTASAKLPGRGHRLLKMIDRYIGVPLVALMGVSRKKRTLPQQINRIGILTTAAIGDTILVGAVVSDLRAAFPASSIVFFAGDSNHAVAKLLSPALSALVIHLPVYRPFQASRIIRERHLDLLIDFGPWPRLNAIISWLSGADFTAGFRTAGQYRHYVYDLAVEHSRHVHELENHRRMISALGLETTHSPTIDPSKLTDDTILQIPDPYLLFHLWPGGTSSREKEWPTARWVQLATHFAAQGYTIALTGAPSQSRANNDVIAAVNPRYRSRVCNAAGGSLAQTAALLAHSRLVVSVDTGIMHLAAALDLPLIALHGPTSSKRWGPISKNAVAIDSPDPHAGYLYLGFEPPAGPSRCMEAITYERVLDECLKKLVHAQVYCETKASKQVSVQYQRG